MATRTRKRKTLTLKKIVKTNLELLGKQEKELLRSLAYVRTAQKSLKKTAKATPARRGPKPKRTTTATRRGAGRARRTPTVRPGTHLATIVSILKKHNGKASSGQVIQTMFKGQRKDKNFNHYRQLIYPVFTRAYKSGILKLRNGKVHMTA